MTASLAIKLDDAHMARLDALANERRETPAELAARAIAEFLDEDDAFRQAMHEGFAAIEAGDVHDLDAVAAEMTAYVGRKNG
jgi:predicted transcriptional regulator